MQQQKKPFFLYPWHCQWHCQYLYVWALSKSKFCLKFFSWVPWSKLNWIYKFSKVFYEKIRSIWCFQRNVISDLERAQASEHCFIAKTTHLKTLPEWNNLCRLCNKWSSCLPVRPNKKKGLSLIIKPPLLQRSGLTGGGSPNLVGFVERKAL